jgi:F0F1-type ATP synthase assembly protein I
MAQPMITYMSGILHHVASVLLLCWRRVLRVSAIAGGIGVLLVEIVAIVATHRVPDGAAQLAALVLGAALAYAAAITVIAEEVLVGLVDVARLLLGEGEVGARAASGAAGREVSAMGAGVLRLFGLTSATAVLARVGARATSRMAPPPAARMGEREADDDGASAVATDETLADLSPFGDANTVLPPVGPPVRADRLPRIGWTDEHEAVRLDRGAHVSPPRPADRGTVPSPLAEPAGHQMPLASDLPDRATGGTYTEPPFAPVRATGLAEPATWHPEDAPLPGPGTWHDPTVNREEDEEFGGLQPTDAFGAPPPSAVTRPLSQITRPLERNEPEPAPRGSVWDHISQVLAGRPVEPLPAEEGDAPTTGELE